MNKIEFRPSYSIHNKGVFLEIHVYKNDVCCERVYYGWVSGWFKSLEGNIKTAKNKAEKICEILSRNFNYEDYKIYLHNGEKI